MTSAFRNMWSKNQKWIDKKAKSMLPYKAVMLKATVAVAINFLLEIKEFPKDKMEKYSADKIEKLLKPVKLTNEALISVGRAARLFENKETGDRIWLDNRYVKMFDGCNPYSAETEDGIKAVAFIRYGKITGLVLPLRIQED